MKEKIALISVGVNFILGVLKITTGVFSGSVAVLSEGAHSGVDVFSSLICFLGIKLAKKPVDKNHPYGYYKLEVVTGIIITFILATTGIFILVQSYNSFFYPEPLVINPIILAVMFFSALVNEIMARLKIYYGKKEKSVSLVSEGVHSRVDVLSSAVIFIGLLFAPYWRQIDPLLAVLIGVYIIKESFSLGKEAIFSLLDVSAGEEVEQKIKKIVTNNKINIDLLKTQKKGSVITVNLEIKLPGNLSLDKATQITDNLRKEIMEEIENLVYISIQIKSHELETGFYQPKFGRGFGWQNKGRFINQVKKAEGRGIGGYCACLKCGYKINHSKGVPCSAIKCPTCKISLMRK